MKTKNSLKKLEKQVEQAWYRLASGVQVNIMDIGKIFDRGVKSLQENRDLDEEMQKCIQDFGNK